MHIRGLTVLYRLCMSIQVQPFHPLKIHSPQSIHICQIKALPFLIFPKKKSRHVCLIVSPIEDILDISCRFQRKSWKNSVDSEVQGALVFSSLLALAVTPVWVHLFFGVGFFWTPKLTLEGCIYSTCFGF